MSVKFSTVLLSRKTIVLVPVAAALLAFLPTLTASFAWDDNAIQIYQVPAYRTFKDAFFPPPLYTGMHNNFYRPLVTLSYMADEGLNNAINGPALGEYARHEDKRAAIPHGTALFFHLAGTALVTLLALRLFSGEGNAPLGALAAGLAFALHPVHAETVCTIAGRSDSMATAFLLAAMLAALKARERVGLLYPSLASLFFFLAFLSKEIAVTGLVLVPGLYFVFPPANGSKWGNSRPVFGAMLAACALYLGLRFAAGTPGGAEAELPLSGMLWEMTRAVGFYFRKLVIPWPSTPFVPELPGTAATLVSVGSLLAVFLGAFFAWTKGRRELLFLCCWFLVTLAPSLYIVGRTLATSPAAERYLYLPSAALALAIGFFFTKTATRTLQQASLAGFLLLASAWGVSSYMATGIWKSDATLWSYVLAQETPSKYGLPWLNMGNVLLDRQDFDGAAQHYLKVLAPDVASLPETRVMASFGLGQAEMNRGIVAANAGNFPEAERRLLAAREIFAGLAETGKSLWMYFAGLGNSEFYIAKLDYVSGRGVDRENLGSALHNLKKALNLCPGNADLAQRIAEAEGLLAR